MNILLVAVLWTAASAEEARDSGSAIVIGDRRELLVDDFLVDRLSGEARLQLHPPVPQEIVLKTDAPWEGNASGYQSVFRDGPLCRMYYHGIHYRHGGKPAETRPVHPWVLCYAESSDGIHWSEPPQRQVFHIGYNVTTSSLDLNYYDLLASEARIASLIAIAKGEIPQSHWLYLGRPFTNVKGQQALLSWSATMFEYLIRAC